MSVELSGDGPKLRFPPFSEPWRHKPFDDVMASIDSGWSPQCEERPAEDSEWGVLATTSTTWSGYRDTASKALPRSLSPRPDIEVRAGDILITRAGPWDRVGVVAHIDRTRSRLMLSDKLIRVVTNNQNDSRFVATVLGNPRFQRYLAGRKSGLAEAQVNITQDMLRKGPLIVPTLQEQQKIATFLGAVDARIGLLQRRCAALERYKKGIMQRLFAQTLRFKRDDGSVFADWQSSPLGHQIYSLACRRVIAGEAH